MEALITNSVPEMSRANLGRAAARQAMVAASGVQGRLFDSAPPSVFVATAPGAVEVAGAIREEEDRRESNGLERLDIMGSKLVGTLSFVENFPIVKL